MAMTTDVIEIPVLTVHKPFSWAVMEGHKRIENRAKLTKYRRPVLIHAEVDMKRCAVQLSLAQDFARQHGCPVPPLLELWPSLGKILGVVDLGDLKPEERGPWATGPFCWRLANPRKLRLPIQ
jgi:hypothetical protein